MAALIRVALAVALAGCSGELLALDPSATPLVRVRVQVEGELPDAPLHAALVWGAQAQPEPFCFLPPAGEQAAEVVARGCRDPIGFVPWRSGGTARIAPDGSATIELIDLPGTDVMVGQVTGRIAHGSVVVFEDRNGNGALDIRRPEDLPEDPDEQDRERERDRDAGPLDVVHGASFATMSAADLRLTYLEGDFDANAAFYPRAGCPPPPPGFSILGASGFTFERLVAALLAGELPEQESCSQQAPDEGTIVVSLSPPGALADLACRPRRWGGAFGYTEWEDPPGLAPDLEAHAWACVEVADLGSLAGDEAPSGPRPIELVIALPARDAPPGTCRMVQHMTLRGCEEDPECERPEWDRTANPPAWWPCR